MTQYQHFTALICRLALLGLAAISGYGLPISHTSAASADEHANVNAMLRQLNALEDTAQRSTLIVAEPRQRYAFDYERLTNDIAVIRQGLKDYLSPPRAQPRDPVELSGDYTTEARKP